MMKEKENKELYLSPQCDVLNLELQGLIAASNKGDVDNPGEHEPGDPLGMLVSGKNQISFNA